MKEMGRLLALDWGAKRVGVAVCDELRITVRPLPALTGGNWKKSLAAVKALVQDFEAVGLVLGLPLNLDGTDGATAAEVRHRARNFELSLDLPVYLQDERLTSRAAEAYLGIRAQPTKAQRAQIDSLAAVFILQDFLASHVEHNLASRATKTLDRE